MIDIDIIQKASSLIGFALNRKRLPSRAPEYRDLLHRYDADFDFRGAVDAVAEGLGLKVLGASIHIGMTLAPASQDSPFATTLTRYRDRSGLSGVDRAALLAVHVGIASYFFPTGGDIEDSEHDPVPAEAEQITEHLRAASERMAHAETEAVDTDAPIDDDAMRPVWRALNSMDAYRDAKNLTSLNGMTRRVLDDLVEQGLLLCEETGTNRRRYMPTEHYRTTLYQASADFHTLITRMAQQAEAAA